MRRGFTMVELVFVIVMLGILGLISTDIVTQTYRNYAYQKSLADLQSRADRVLHQVGNYLQDAIKPSIAHYDGSNYTEAWRLASLQGMDGGHYLVWIGKDRESLRGVWDGSEVLPAYSGVADIENSSQSTIITPGCDVDTINAMQTDLTGEADWVAGVNYRSALYFVYANSGGSVEQRFWNGAGGSLFRISGVAGNDQIHLADAPPQISEKYYLTYSAYGLQLEGDGTLRLYYNFRPWNGEDVADGTTQVMSSDVESFEIWSESQGSLLRIKLCLRSETGNLDSGMVVCRETVVLR